MPWVVKKVHSTLHNALAYTQQTGVLVANPASLVLVPKQPEQEIQIWEESEISQFFVSILGHRLEALYHLAITTGMRQMELLGLKWEDLDWEKQAIEIKRHYAGSR